MKVSRRKSNQIDQGHLTERVIDQWLQEHGDPAIERLVEKNLAIANKIKQILTSKGMRPADLAKRMSKQKSEVSKWLSGQHTFTTRTITSIEAALDTDIIHIEPIRQNVYFRTYVRVPSTEELQDVELEFEESEYSGDYISA